MFFVWRRTTTLRMILDALDGRFKVLCEAYKRRTGGIGSSLKSMGCAAEQAADIVSHKYRTNRDKWLW